MVKSRISTPRAEIAPLTLLLGDLLGKGLSYAEHLDFLLSVRDARFATMFQFFLDYAWWVMALGAGAWLIYESRRHKADPNAPGSVGALVFSSATVAFILGVMVTVSATGSLPIVLQMYGADTTAGTCVATVDTSRLTGFKNDYRVILICGAHDPSLDPQEDSRISVSSLFHINGQAITITAPFGRLKEVWKDAVPPPLPVPLPPGQTQVMSLQLWHLVALVPADTDPTTIKRVSDITREGGRIITDPIGGYGSTTVLPSPSVTVVPKVTQQ